MKKKIKKIQSLTHCKERTITEILNKIESIQKEYNLSSEKMLSITSVFFRDEIKEIKIKNAKINKNKQLIQSGEKSDIQQVFSKFCEILNVSESKIKSSSRKKELVAIRHVIAYSLKIRKYILEDIALVLGRVNHTTMSHATTKVASILSNELDKSDDRHHMITMFNKLNPNIKEYQLLQKEIQKNERDILTGAINSEEFLAHADNKIKKINGKYNS